MTERIAAELPYLFWKPTTLSIGNSWLARYGHRIGNVHNITNAAMETNVIGSVFIQAPNAELRGSVRLGIKCEACPD
jgi:hypothetical protein